MRIHFWSSHDCNLYMQMYWWLPLLDSGEVYIWLSELFEAVKLLFQVFFFLSWGTAPVCGAAMIRSVFSQLPCCNLKVNAWGSCHKLMFMFQLSQKLTESFSMFTWHEKNPKRMCRSNQNLEKQCNYVSPTVIIQSWASQNWTNTPR